MNRERMEALLRASEGDVRLAALLDVLWSNETYERLVGSWRMSTEEAVDAVTWALGALIEPRGRRALPTAECDALLAGSSYSCQSHDTNTSERTPVTVVYEQTHLDRLESESVHIFREVAATEFERPGPALLGRQGLRGHAPPGAGRRSGRPRCRSR